MPALLAGVSRVYPGVHRPADIIAGWIAGDVRVLLSLFAGRWFCSVRQQPEYLCKYPELIFC